MPRTRLTFSLTETRQFRRLVQFLADVEEYADDELDVELQALVREARDDLLRDSDDT